MSATAADALAGVPRAWLDLPPEARAVAAARALLRANQRSRMSYFYPDEGPLRRELYPKHIRYFEAGGAHRQRAAISGNRTGKSDGLGAYETTVHLTGDYPAWWPGRRFTRPIKAWACGETSKTVREIVQSKLLGIPGNFGTGMIPGDCILRTTPHTGVPDAVDKVEVRHASGGVSVLMFKSYEQGREAFEGDEQDFIWLDEKFPLDVYVECLTRTMTTGGLLSCTFTPTDGLTPGVLQFMPGGRLPTDGIRHVTVIGWDDCPHLTEAAKAELRATYPAHEIKARTLGIPHMGSGGVFASVPEESIRWKRTEIPKHWPRICGIDFGWDHPTAAAWIAWDRDADVIYVYDCYRVRQQTPIVHAAAIRSRGPWIPVAWPADGLQTEKGSGIQLSEQYRGAGLNMTSEPARLPETMIETETNVSRVSVEAGVMEMLTRMETGRLKIAEELDELWEEYRMYHRKDGKIVKVNDDIISALRYSVVSLRFASVEKRVSSVLSNRPPPDWRA